MIISTPLKEKKARPNVRKAPSRRQNGKRRTKRNGSVNGRSNNRSPKAGKKKLSLPLIRPWKVILGAFLMGALGVLYLSHVFATQELLEEVQRLENRYNQAKRMNDDYRLTYDRMIGPAEIYPKARSMGFINGGPAEKVLEVEQP